MRSNAVPASTLDWVRDAVSRRAIQTPCLVLDLDYTNQTHALMRKHLAGVQFFYSVKANNDPAFLAHLHSLGIGFDVASINELELAKSVGAEPETIILSNTIKSAQTVRQLFNNRVKATTFDSEHDLRLIAQEATFHSERPKLLVRIKVQSLDVHIDLNEKFGCTVDEAVRLVEVANSLGLSVDGVHFHVGTQCWNTESYRLGIESALSLMQKAPIAGKILNIGGGFPDPIVAEKAGGLDLYFAQLGQIVEIAKRAGCEIWAEPGRVLASGSGLAVSQVLGSSNRDGKNWLFLDDGIYGLFSTAHYEGRKFEFELARASAADGSFFILAGPTCDSLDVIDTKAYLPSDVAPGDYLIAPIAGAYSISVQCHFNGLAQISTAVPTLAVVEIEE